jgi:hypothetical protein
MMFEFRLPDSHTIGTDPPPPFLQAEAHLLTAGPVATVAVNYPDVRDRDAVYVVPSLARGAAALGGRVLTLLLPPTMALQWHLDTKSRDRAYHLTGRTREEQATEWPWAVTGYAALKRGEALAVCEAAR